MRVAVFGATGEQGVAQISALTAANHTPIAVSRRPTLTGEATVETRLADFNDLDAVRAAINGVDAVFLNLPSFQPPEPLIAAARVIGREATKQPSLKLIVLNTSMPVPEKSANIETQEDRREIRRVLREETELSGVSVVSIQPVVYLDNLLSGWMLHRLRDEGRIVYCHKPDLEVSWISHDDLVALMVAALTRDPKDLDGRDIPVGGPETVRLSQLAEQLSTAWGREVGYESQSVKDFATEFSERIGDAMAGLEKEGVVDEMRRAYAWYNNAEEKPFRVDMGPVLEVLPAKLTSIEAWGRRKGSPF
ncbi:NAD(P)H azoreductase [Colletotrichum orbiculare MAFF 240422]|uniref:NAD(P)H azoreductase n=1 Tax=Colletotrichum orbiculare (strain 104-T / ATCC 96160 / CBS 514.97 / LARS 414 / MAFF 240422) TaxID=1213857 RepID=N4VGA4_COLOR|nr:NAD(P)H azoreductase [Colletotrichum orbiculare MAFF 240422]